MPPHLHATALLALLCIPTFARAFAVGEDVRPRRAQGAEPPAAQDPTDDSSEDNLAALQELVLNAASAKLGFLDNDGDPIDEPMLKGGEVGSAFACDGSSVAELARERSSVALRRLSVERVGSMLPDLGFSEPSPILIKYIRVSTNASKQSALVGVGFEAEDTTDNLSVDGSASFGVTYDCARDGDSVVELRLAVSAGRAGPGIETCLRWVKTCLLGFSALEIREGNELLFSKGEIAKSWQERMVTEGTHSSVTKLSLTTSGLELYEPPEATSSAGWLRAEVRGAFYLKQTIEVGVEPVDVSVMYTCLSDGIADVTLRLRRVTVASKLGPPQELRLKWRKRCGVMPHSALSIFLRGDRTKVKTEVVSRGVALPGFSGSCPDCVSKDTGDLRIEVSPVDTRTVLELRVGGGPVSDEAPAFRPLPDLAYDRRAMRAEVTYVQGPRGQTHKAGKYSVQNETMVVKYTCYKDGVSVVMITIHVLAHKPIELAWRKRCKEPRITRSSRALTAPQALLVAMFLSGIVVIAVLICCYACNDRERRHDDMNGHSVPSRVELGRNRKAKSPSAETVGFANARDEDEVVYH